MSAVKTEDFIKQEVVNHLIWDASVNADDVIVDIADGSTVQLSGVVPSYTAKIAAERDAYRVADVRRVENQIQVEFPSGIDIPADIEITNMIDNRLLWNDQIDETRINVDTLDGSVTLTGSVNSFWQKNLVNEIAYTTPGVLQVDNNLTVIAERPVADLDIEEDIKRAFKRNILIDVDKVNVRVSNGVAHLSGTVPYFSMKKEAFDTAMLTLGVVEVVDEIIIE